MGLARILWFRVDLGNMIKFFIIEADDRSVGLYARGRYGSR